MQQLIEANWLVFLIALGVAIAVALWLFARGSRPRQRAHRPDVLDEGVGPARRNQALIDAAPPAAAFDVPIQIDPPAMAGTMAGIGEIIAVAAQDEAEAALPPAVPPPPVEEAPPVQPAPAPVATGTGPDDLTRIKGIGPKLAALLPTLGVTGYAQIAAMKEADLDALDGELGAFAGRPRRDKWVEQAALLAADPAAYEAKFGKI